MSYLQELLDYSEEVTNGSEASLKKYCTKHIWACQRFINDIHKSRTDPDYPFYFDEDRAFHFVKFASLFKHTKGVLSGKKIELHPILQFISGNIYGWYKKEDDCRRFTKLYWQVGRKNAKSQLLSIMCLYELFYFCGAEVTEIYTAAVKHKQALIVYNEALLMLNACDSLVKGKHYTTTNGQITRIKNGSFMRALSKEDGKDGDGFNPQFGSVDEFHLHKNDDMYNIIDSGQIGRTQPLIAIITTAGRELQYPCYRVEYALVSKILDPDDPADVDFYFVMVNELETNRTDEPIMVGEREVRPGEILADIEDPDSWEMANPIACSHKSGIDKIKKRLDLALLAEDKMPDFLTKNMNVWINKSAFGYMDLNKWALCGVSTEELTDLIRKKTKMRCYVGTDLSSTEDLTSVSFEFIGDDNRYYVVSHSFMPEGVLREKIEKDHVPYDIWEKHGWITLTTGNMVDYKEVKKWILDKVEDFGWIIEEIDFDPWFAAQIASDFIEDGYEAVKVVQGLKTLAPPTKDFRANVYDRRVVHDNNPVLAWALGNAVTKMDHNESFMLDKSKSAQKIDPAAAIMNSHSRAMLVEKKPQQRVMFL